MFEELVTALASKNISLTSQQFIYLKILCENEIVPSRLLAGRYATNLSSAMLRLQSKINYAGFKCSISSRRIKKERDSLYGWSIKCEQVS